MDAALPFMMVASVGSSLLGGLAARQDAKTKRQELEREARVARLRGEIEANNLEREAETVKAQQIAQISTFADVMSPTAMALARSDSREVKRSVKDIYLDSRLKSGAMYNAANSISTSRPLIGALANATGKAISYHALYTDMYPTNKYEET